MDGHFAMAPNQTKPTQSLTALAKLLPSILSQMGPEGMANFAQLTQQMRKDGAPLPAADAGDDSDDDIPDLVENFEDASEAQ